MLHYQQKQKNKFKDYEYQFVLGMLGKPESCVVILSPQMFM